MITTKDGTCYHAKTVILASSLGIISPRRLKIDDGESYGNLRYVATEVINFDEYIGKTVLLYGNPESILEYAILLQKLAKTVILVTKKAHFDNVSLLLDNVIIYTKTDIKSLKKMGSVISEVKLSNGTQLDVAYVLVHLGTKYEAKNIAFENIDVTTVDQNDRIFIQNKSDTTTNIAGLFVVGDLGSYEGKQYRLAACLAEATKAATQAAIYLDATVGEQLPVSTHNDVFNPKNKAIKLNYFN